MRYGSTTPRLWTPPLRDLTPETSDGFDHAEYARSALNRPPLPWQEWYMIHAGELLPDGRPRFRIVLGIVSRQNGKTEIPVVLTPYWMLVDGFRLVLGTSTKLEYAKDTWDKTRLLLKGSPLEELMGSPRWYVKGNNLTDMWDADERCHYRIAAANEEGGRSLTIDRGVADELRQHKDRSAWNAMEPAASHEWSQIHAFSNAGDDTSVVLNSLRAAALAYIEWANQVGPDAADLIAAGKCPHDYRLGLFEWSAPESADPEDEEALLQANPRVGYGRNLEDLLLEARRAKEAGGEELAGFKTEKMCIRVRVSNPAIDPGAWLRCIEHGNMDALRGRIALCVDVAPDGMHATLVAAGLQDDERVRAEVVGAWDGVGCVDKLRRALPGLVRRVKPRTLGWFPSGPAAALAATLLGTVAGVEVTEIRGDVAAVCMGLDEQVSAHRFVHSSDPLLDDHVGAAERLPRGDVWVFSRKGEGHVDAAYALAGAVHLARTLPPSMGRPRLVGPSGDG